MTAMTQPDQLPRIFQANVDRLFQRVIRPGLDALPIHLELHFDESSSMYDRLAYMEAQVDNYTANEGAKGYALMLAGLFERQLRIWARSRKNGTARDKVEKEKFRPLLADCAHESGVDLQSNHVGKTLTEMFLVGNVFRHGDGGSVKDLRMQSPQLWTYEKSRYMDILPPGEDKSEKLLLEPDDVVRYANACVHFWGQADKLEGSTIAPRYENIQR